MKTLILKTVMKLLVPLFLGFSIYFFFRGHNQPGGGFIGALIASFPFILYAMAFGVEKTNYKFRILPGFIVGCGLLLASFSGMFSLLAGNSYLTALWVDLKLPLIGKLGTPLFFDAGVYLTVLGVILKISYLMLED